MCLYPKLIPNKKYRSTKKNGGTIPKCQDERVKWVPVGCGKCIECLRQKARNWQVRLFEEIHYDKSGLFVTLTFSEESLNELVKEFGVTESNYIATKAVRRFLERWRKATKKSVKHWLITELGHQNTERIHLHGIIWTNKDEDFISKTWSYGNIFIGNYVNERTINYISKYVTKIDTDHKNYVPIILCSAGIGKNYLNSEKARINQYNGELTQDNYRNNSGYKQALPIYYRNKIYTEKERELLWIQRLNKEERWVLGQKIDVSNGLELYEKIREEARQLNRRVGYGDDSKEWQKKSYNVTCNMLKKLTDTVLEKSNPAEFYKLQAEKVKAKEKREMLKITKNFGDKK